MSDDESTRDLQRDYEFLRRILAELERDGVDDMGEAMVLAFARFDREQHASIYESLSSSTRYQRRDSP